MEQQCELIEAPIFEGSNGPGPEKAYNIIKTAIATKNRYCFRDFIGQVNSKIIIDKFGTKNINKVTTICENVRLSVLNSFMNNRFPIIIGGDHSIAMASIASGSEYYGIDDYAVIYIDGHCDINTERTSTSHNIHGMPLASSLGLCAPTLQIGNNKKKLYGNNLYILGPRSIDKPEYDIIKNNDVHLYENVCFFNDYNNILESIKKSIGKKKVHISFDVDVLDPSFFSSTYYLMENGLSFKIVESLFDFFFRNLNVVSVDIVEYNPEKDKEKKDIDFVLSLINRITDYVNRLN